MSSTSSVRSGKTLCLVLAGWLCASATFAQSVPATPTPLQLMPRHSADVTGDAFAIDDQEFQLVLDIWQNGGYGIDLATPEGYRTNSTDTGGIRHSADYAEPAWGIGYEEILRALALKRAESYQYTPAAPGGFAPVPEQAAYIPPNPAEFTGAVRYVAAGSPDPIAPYTNPVHAAATIQDAVDVSLTGDLILIDEGVYDTGGRSTSLGNSRVVVTNGVVLASLHGPGRTRIIGDAATFTRGIYVNHPQAELHGLGISQGHTDGSASSTTARHGGGILALAAKAIRHCDIDYSTALPWGTGGGMYIQAVSGRVEQVSIRHCQASTGGGAAAILGDKLLINGMTIVSNSAVNAGGIVVDNAPRVINLLVLHNHASQRGGGVYFGNFSGVWFATVLHNTAGIMGGGVYFHLSNGHMSNAILLENGTNGIATAGSNNLISFSHIGASTQAVINYSNIVPGAPDFVNPGNGNYRLSQSSSLINAGNMPSWITNSPGDLDGTPRSIGSAPDLGVYETAPLIATTAPASYIPGSNLTIDVTIIFPTQKKPLTLGAAFSLPANWTLLDLQGPGSPQATSDGHVFTGDLPSSMTVTLTVFAAETTTGTVHVAADLLWMADGMIDFHLSGLTPENSPIIPSYPFVLSTTGQGSLDIEDGWHPVGSIVTITAIADPGWRFLRWLGDTNNATMIGDTIDVPMPEQGFSVTAEFIQLREVSVNSPYGTSVPSSGMHAFDDNSLVTITMVDASVMIGQTQVVCVGWNGTGSIPAVGSARSVDFVISEDSSIQWLWTTFSARHASRGYRPAGIYTATVECEIDFDPAPTIQQIWWIPQLPSAATLESVTGDGNPQWSNGAILIQENLTEGSLRFSYTFTLDTPLSGPLSVGGEAGVNDLP